MRTELKFTNQVAAWEFYFQGTQAAWYRPELFVLQPKALTEAGGWRVTIITVDDGA